MTARSLHPPGTNPKRAGRPDATGSATDFVWRVRVYFEDTDTGGVVYHAGYLRFYERCRTEWLRARGYSQQALMETHGIAFAVRSMAIDWRAPACLDDELDIGLHVREARRASIKADQRIVRVADGALLGHAHVRVACVSLPDFRPVPIPDELLENLSA